MQQQRQRGIRAEDIRRGTLIDGRRVVAMRVGLTSAGQRATTVQFPDVDRKGRKRLSDPVTYLHGTFVDGTRTPTTWAMPAGPVGRKPGGTLHGGWYGDRADRHHRMINSLVYR